MLRDVIFVNIRGNSRDIGINLFPIDARRSINNMRIQMDGDALEGKETYIQLNSRCIYLHRI